MVSKRDYKWARGRLRILLDEWEETPELSLRQLIEDGAGNPDLDMRGNVVGGKE